MPNNLTIGRQLVIRGCHWLQKSFCGDVVQILTHLMLRILPIDLCSSIGGWLGKQLYPIDTRADKLLRYNLEQLRPDLDTPDKINAMVMRTWENNGRVMAEFSVLRRLWKSDRMRWEGVDNFVQVRASGRPLIFLFVHLGNWELIGPKLLEHPLVAGQGMQISQLLDNKMQRRIAANIRRPYSKHLISTGPNVGKIIYDKIKKNYSLSLAIDEHVPSKLNTPSLGRPLNLKGNLAFAVRLARLTNAVLCPIYVTREKGAHFVLHCLPPIDHDFINFDKTQIRAVIAEIDAMIETIVCQHIDQWYYASRTQGIPKRK